AAPTVEHFEDEPEALDVAHPAIEPGPEPTSRPEAPRQVAEPRKAKSLPLSDAEAARVVLDCAESRKAPAQKVRVRLDPYWDELAGKAVEGGEKGLAEALEWVGTRDAGRAGEIRGAIEAARAVPEPPDGETDQASLDVELACRPLTDYGNA